MTTIQLHIDGTQWSDDPTWIFGLIPAASIRGHIAYDTSRHRLFTASELQEQLVALGWPEGECIDLADDTPPFLSVTLELTDEDFAALQQRVDAEAAGTITIDADVEFETARRTVEVPDLEGEVQAVEYISVPGLIVALSTLHPGADVRDAAAYQAAITDVLALIVRQRAPQLHLVTHNDLVTIESVLHTSRQILIVGESDMSPTQEYAFEDDLNRMCVVTRAYLGMKDEEDDEYVGPTCSDCGAGEGCHRDDCPSLLPDPETAMPPLQVIQAVAELPTAQDPSDAAPLKSPMRIDLEASDGNAGGASW